VMLADVATFSNGANFTRDAFGHGLKIIGVRDFGDRVSPDWDDVDEVSPDAASQRQHLQEGDLVLVRSNGNPALVGRCLLITDGPPATHSAFTIRVRADREMVEPRFLAYQMRHAHKAGRMGIASGTNITNLNQSILGAMEICLPALPIQRQIASILGSLDELIDINQRQIAQVDQMAQVIYREWFVHFRYPGHQDDELIDSPVGPRPEGWTSRSLKEVASIVMGQSPKSEHYNESGDGLPFHQGVSNFGSHYPHHRLYCRIDGRIAEANDHLLSVRAPVGRINRSDQRIVIGRGLAAIRSTDELQSLLGRELRRVFSEEDAMGGGTIFNAITKGDLEELQVIQTTAAVAKAAEKILSPIDELIRVLTFQSRVLARVRDALLPKLVTGAIDVSKLDLKALLEEPSV
jgi:type I restriction enzyme S subunit